jgi:hypothetical protein
MMLERFVTAYVEELRRRADDRRQEASASAGVYDRVAVELEERMRAYLDEELTAQQAAQESGYSEAQMHKLKREGLVLRRGNLPRHAPKPQRDTVGSIGGPSLADHVLSRHSGAA